jgi:hypothetical protein
VCNVAPVAEEKPRREVFALRAAGVGSALMKTRRPSESM